jgi:Flp pilus assembly pilin Flp
VLMYLPAMGAYVRARLGGLHGREEGVTAVEYALMVAIVALLLAGAFYALFETVNERYGNVGDCLSSGPVPAACSPPEATSPPAP